jgi:hypothetical protein
VPPSPNYYDDDAFADDDDDDDDDDPYYLWNKYNIFIKQNKTYINERRREIDWDCDYIYTVSNILFLGKKLFFKLKKIYLKLFSYYLIRQHHHEASFVLELFLKETKRNKKNEIKSNQIKHVYL